MMNYFKTYKHNQIIIKNVLTLRIKTGFTLIELLIAMALTAMISSGILLLFNTALNTWIFGEASAKVQEKASLCMDQIIEGAYKYDGLREVLEISNAKEHALSYIPWWEQKISSLDPSQKIPLEFPVHPSSPIPMGQIWSTSKNQYVFINLIYYPKGILLKDNKSYVKFPKEIPKGSRARIFFYPLFTGTENIEMTIFWNPDKKNLFRRYKNQINPLIRLPDEMSVTHFKLEYQDASNSIIPVEKLHNLSYSNNPVTAIRAILTLTQGDVSYTLRSFVNIRKKGIAGTGTLMTEGGKLKIPNSFKIKTLSLINFFGITKAGKLSCTISSKTENKTYGITIKFNVKNEIPWIEHYDIEFPKGKKVFSQDPDFPASRGINFLTIDFAGFYDYDIDEALTDIVLFKATDVEFEIDKSTIGGAYLLVR